MGHAVRRTTEPPRRRSRDHLLRRHRALPVRGRRPASWSTSATSAPAARAGQMRRDPLSGDWIAMATHRLDRTFMPPADECPLCPTGRGTEPSEMPGRATTTSSCSRTGSRATPPATARSRRRRGPGRHLGRTPRPPGDARSSASPATTTRPSPTSTPYRVRTVIDAWADRTVALGPMPEVAQVFPFENRGKEIGVTLQHPHGQIYGYPLVTPRTATMLARAAEHRERTGRPAAARHPRRRAGRRLAGRRSTGEHWTAYVPYAARWPVEVHLAPHRDVPDLPALDDDGARRAGPRLPRPAAAARPLLRRRRTAGRCGCRTSPAGTRRPPARGATWPGCTCS